MESPTGTTTDAGTVQGDLIRADATGWSIGALGKTSLDEQSRTFLTGGISYGRYSFDGTRGSASATAAGWRPGLVNYSDVDSDAMELFIGIETTVYHDEHFRLIPSAGLPYATGTVDDFTEITGASPGSPIALKVSKDHQNSTLAEMALRAETDLTPRLMAWGQAGFNLGLGDDPHGLTAAFATGSRPMRAEATGLTNDLFFLGLGSDYRLTEAISLGIGYRAEFRPSHPTQQSCNLSSTFRF